jgi:pyridine nucleotide-disulfide oxidoreductase family protein
MNKRLVLLGGGHAHVHVLDTLAAQPLEGVEVTLLSPSVRQVYSGMLPGWVAGHYTIEQCVIPLRPLCQRAKVAFHETHATRVDLDRNIVFCADGGEIAFDTLSIDTGPVADVSSIPGAAENAISIRPIESFITLYQQVADEIRNRRDTGRIRLAFVGAGAGGVELAMAMQHAFRDIDLGVTLISAANTLPGNVGPRLGDRMRDKGLAIFANQSAAEILPEGVRLASGGIVEADQVFVATGASAAKWPHESGLVADKQGFILVNDHLQSVSHANVFAAGDCATMEHHPRPKSGVYAVRAGPPLAENLRRYLTGDELKRYVPQARSLYLISAGEKYAIGSWGKWSWEGRWVWWWKDWIDRKFMGKYSGAGS